jgi:exonuclease SbcD
VLDFLKSLDTIIAAAIAEKVDLVIFAGDAYRDRSPAPTFQREWGKRIIRLSKAGIRTLLLVGNHDLSPALGRANAIQEFETLDIPQVTVLAKPAFLSAGDLGLPIQVIAIPWVSRSGLMAVTSVQGAKYGSERTVMLGADLVLPGSLVRDPRLDYVALGHIHKSQNLNENDHPPVIYPGSIERVDFGEAGDDKYYVVADITRGKTEVRWCKLEHTRPFIDRRITLDSPDNVTETLTSALPVATELEGAIVRLTVNYPREWDTLIDEPTLRRYVQAAFEFHLIKHAKIEARIRLPADQSVNSLGPLELLNQYWRASHAEEGHVDALQKLAKEIIEEE